MKGLSYISPALNKCNDEHWMSKATLLSISRSLLLDSELNENGKYLQKETKF